MREQALRPLEQSDLLAKIYTDHNELLTGPGDDCLARVVGLIVGTGSQILGVPTLLQTGVLALVAKEIVFRGRAGSRRN